MSDASADTASQQEAAETQVECQDQAMRESYATWFGHTFPSLLNYLVNHMIESPFFYPATAEKACRSCDYESVCRFSYVS